MNPSHPVPTSCIACGELLDRDSTACRVCGQDNSPEAILPDEPELESASFRLDQLGEWSQIKHEIIEKYAHAYTTIISHQRFIKAVKYVDAYAGAGIAEARDTGELLVGSAARALGVTPPFDELHFIEENVDKATMLEGLVTGDPRAHVHRGDAVRILTNDVLPRCLYRDYVRALCFLDPYGLQVPWALVNEIGHMGSVEIFYNFMIVGANRNVLWTDPDSVPSSRLAIMDRVWGDRTWKDAAYRRRTDLFGDTRPEKVPNEELAEAFRTRLRDGAGFKYVPEPIAMKNSRKATVYFLFFASPNDTANKIVTDIFSKYR